jgi:hypothetical protein
LVVPVVEVVDVPVVDVPVVVVVVTLVLAVSVVPTVLTTPVVSVVVAVAPVEVTLVSTAAVSVLTFSSFLQEKAKSATRPIARSVRTRFFFIRKTPFESDEKPEIDYGKDVSGVRSRGAIV